MLYGLYRPHHFYIYIYAKTQPNATSTSYVITLYMQDTNMSTELGIYTIYTQNLICISWGCMCIYVPHIKLVQFKTLSCTKWYRHINNMTTYSDCYRLNLTSRISQKLLQVGVVQSCDNLSICLLVVMLCLFSVLLLHWHFDLH